MPTYPSEPRLSSLVPSDAFRSQVIQDGLRLALDGEALEAFIDRERHLAALEVLSEYHGDWTAAEAAEYFELSAQQVRLSIS